MDLVQPHIDDRRGVALLTALGITAIAFVASAVVPLVVFVALHVVGIRLSLPAVVGLVIVLVHGVAFCGTAALYLRSRGIDWRAAGVVPPTAGQAMLGLAGYVAALGGAAAAGGLASALGATPARHDIAVLGEQSPQILPLLMVLSIALIGPAEELLFRGVVQRRLREAFSPWLAIALASAIFAAAHAFALTDAPSARLVTIAILFVPSVVFGVIYEATGNLVITALMHGAYNATLFALLYQTSAAP